MAFSKFTESESIFTDISDKDLSKICKKLIKLNTKKMNNPIKKLAKNLNRLLQRGHTEVK